uniref:Single Ig and TIR domain containing n=1 Tax=Bos mutus grunniens TaxID=30521 RepID=A0A8B9XR84_BOSMU
MDTCGYRAARATGLRGIFLAHRPSVHSGRLASQARVTHWVLFLQEPATRPLTSCPVWKPGPGACPGQRGHTELHSLGGLGAPLPLPSVQWLKGGLLLSDGSLYDLHEDSWVKTNWSEVLVSSVLGINLTRAEDFGTFTCSIRNISSSSFTLWRAGLAGHAAAVLASLLALLALLLVALLYMKCRLNVLLWYQDKYGEVEMNDGKLYDAYISYSDSPEDRKFVNFILKPQLERHRGYKLFLDDRDLLPRAEPSADLLVNLSRCRRLVVVLSDAFLGRAWCSHSFREGLCRLLELTRRPIFITFEGQRATRHPALRLLRQHRHLVTLLLWKPGSVVRRGAGGVLWMGPREWRLRGQLPRGVGFWGRGGQGLYVLAPPPNPILVFTHVNCPLPPDAFLRFWKELRLALPRKVQYRSMEGDPRPGCRTTRTPC